MSTYVCIILYVYIYMCVCACVVRHCVDLQHKVMCDKSRSLGFIAVALLGFIAVAFWDSSVLPASTIQLPLVDVPPA